MMTNKITFPLDNARLLQELRDEVYEYFEVNGIEKTGNASLYFKSFVMFLLFFAPFTIVVNFHVSFWENFFLATVSGFGMAGVGMNVMHDANHRTYHKKKWVSRFVADLMFILPTHPFNWINQHNIAHHTHTNISGGDEDFESSGIFRFTKEQKWKPYHRFQHLYAIPLYGATTFMRAAAWSFTRMRKYFRDHPEAPVAKKRKEWTTLISLRIVYFFFWIGVPLLFGENEWYFALIFFLVMHFVCGVILTTIFQLAHMVPIAQTFESDDEKDSWIVHQLKTTSNFATGNAPIRWFCGGLTHQIEHHLFTNICHVHYRKIVEKKVRDFCKRKGIPYLEYKTFQGALNAHFGLLRDLGRKPA